MHDGMNSALEDPIKELRLRRWARQNYVPLEDRESSWHPIVLAEMRQRDMELQHEYRVTNQGHSFVPLAPTEQRFLHPPHNEIPAPKLVDQAARTRETSTDFAGY